MPPSAEGIEEENGRLKRELEGLRFVLSQEIAAKASLQASLHDSAERYLDLTERAPWIVARVDAAGRYSDVNRCLAETLGVRPSDLLDRNIGDAGESESWVRNLTDFLASPSDASRETETSVREEELSAGHRLLMFRARGEAAFTVLACDESERLGALERAQAASVAKSEFLAVMSHAIRTPMNGVVGSTEQLLHTQLDHQQAQLVRAVEGASRELVGTIDDVISLGGLIEEQQLPEPSVLSPWDVVQSAVQSLSSHASEYHSTLALERGSGVPDRALGASKSLTRMTVHLLLYGFQASRSGGLRLDVSGSCAVRRISGNPSCMLTIRLEFQEREQPFPGASLTGDGTPESGAGLAVGSGLNLYLARRLAESLGGTYLDERDATGHTRSITLQTPLHATSEPGPADSQPPAKAPALFPVDLSGALDVLVAEDNPVNRRVAESILKRLGCRVTSVVDGAKAVEIVRKQPFDLILMDIDMPVLDGIGATLEIRRLEASGDLLPRNERMQIVAFTANAATGDRATCLASGMDDHMFKPLDKARLAEVLQTCRQTVQAQASQI